MRIIEKNAILDDSNDNGLSHIVCKCGCQFSANESDIEEQITSIPYESGIKKLFKITKSYIPNRYITCPNCYRKMKVKFYVEDYKNEQRKY